MSSLFIIIIIIITIIIIIIITELYWKHINLTVLKMKIKQLVIIYKFKLYIQKY